MTKPLDPFSFPFANSLPLDIQREGFVATLALDFARSSPSARFGGSRSLLEPET
jgi:hypothetical protein